MFTWLKDWDDVQINGNKKEVTTNPFAFKNRWADMPKPNAKAALLSGPPGIGKTTACKIVCKILGFEILEMNASDVRNKASIQENITTVSSNTSIDYFTTQNQKRLSQLK